MSILDNTPLDMDQWTGGKIFKGTPIEGIGDNGASDKAAQEEQTGNAERAYSGLQTPSFSTVNYANPNAEADVVASQANAEGQGASAYNDISVDPSYKQAQADQMAALSTLAKNGGANATSRANLAQIQQGANANANAQRGAILQNAQMRGQGGGGASLLAQLNATQNAQNQANSQGLNVAAMNQQNALQAGQGAAGIGAGLENQEYGEQAQAARARDTINQFNAANKTQANEFNSSQGNAIALQNTARRQAVENARVAAVNAGIQQNQITSPQQQYQNELARAGGVANTNMAGAKLSQADRAAALKNQQNIWNGAIGLGGQAWSALGGGSGIASMLGMGGGGGEAWAGADGIGELGAGGAAAGEGGTAVDVAAGAADAGTMAATGGIIPGTPKVQGDSKKNDTIPIKASPGEVVVPRSVAKMGTPEEIARFVKNPPKVQEPSVSPLNTNALFGSQTGVISEAGAEKPLDQKRTAEMRALHSIANKGRVRI